MSWIWCVRVVLLPGSAHHLEVMGSEGLCPKVSPVHPAVQGYQQATRQVCRWGECRKSTPVGLLPEPMCNCVTKKIGTLCVCCCTLYVALSMFFHVWTSFNLLYMFYVLLFWMSLKEVVRERAKRQYQQPLTDTIKKEKNKTEISGCGSFVVTYFQPATFINRLHMEPFLLLVRYMVWVVNHHGWIQMWKVLLLPKT